MSQAAGAGAGAGAAASQPSTPASAQPAAASVASAVAPKPLEALIAPSLLSGDFGLLALDCCKMVACGADWLHMDVMDGHFVPNITIGAPVIKSLRKHCGKEAFLDMHMMVSNPDQWVSDLAVAGADSYTFHYEATDDPFALIRNIRANGMKVGVAIKPKTDWQKVVDLAPLVDMILVMTVEPGFGGQKFMEDMMPKVTALRARFPTLNIQVDGGVDGKTVHKCAAAGANVIVSGSGVFNAADGPRKAMAQMKAVVNNHLKASAAATPAAPGTSAAVEDCEKSSADVKTPPPSTVAAGQSAAGIVIGATPAVPHHPPAPKRAASAETNPLLASGWVSTAPAVVIAAPELDHVGRPKHLDFSKLWIGKTSQVHSNT